MLRYHPCPTLALVAVLTCARWSPAQPFEPSTADPAVTVPTTSPQPAEDSRLVEARSMLSRGRALFSAGNYDAALAEFMRASELLRGHPRQYIVLNNIAVCHERMFRYDMAVRYYEEYLGRAPENEADRTQVTAVLQTLRSLLATLRVESSVPTEVWVDNRLVGTGPGKVLIPSGRHSVELRASLYESQRMEVHAAAGQTQSIRFAPRRLSTYEAPSRAYFWVALGLTGAAVGMGSVFGIKALAANDAGEDKARAFLPSEAEAEHARDFSLAADVSFGAAVVFGAASLVLHFVTDPSSGAPTAERRAMASRASAFSVQLNPRRRTLALQGAF